MARPTNSERTATSQIGFPQVFSFASGNEEFLTLPVGRRLFTEMRKMVLTDETVGAMMWCITSTLAQVKWTFVPQVDGKDAETDEEAIRMAEFANTLLIDMRDTFNDHVEDALAMIWAGFAPCEIVLKRRDGVSSRFNDKFYGIDHMTLCDPRTVIGWDYNAKREVAAMRQMGIGGMATIPMWKLLHYRVTSEMDNPYGRPLLLNAWRVWRLKTKIQDIEAIGIERELVGMPYFKLPLSLINTAKEVKADGSPTDDALAAQAFLSEVDKVVSSLRFNKSGGLYYPSDPWATEEDKGGNTPMFDFGIMTSSGQRAIDTRTPARDYDRAIARVLLFQFLHLGDRSTGSYSLSDDQSSMAYKSLTALVVKIYQEFNRKALPLIWMVNGFDKKFMPALKAGEISKESLQQIGAWLGGLAKMQAIWDQDEEARMSIGKTAGISLDRAAQKEAAGHASDTAEMKSKPPPTPAAPKQGKTPK